MTANSKIQAQSKKYQQMCVSKMMNAVVYMSSAFLVVFASMIASLLSDHQESLNSPLSVLGLIMELAPLSAAIGYGISAVHYANLADSTLSLEQQDQEPAQEPASTQK